MSFKFIFVFLIIFSTTLLQNAQAENSCALLFAPTPSLHERLSESHKTADWSPQKNIFSDTLGMTILNGVTWLTAVQMAKSGFLLHGVDHAHVFNSTFFTTVPIDVVLTGVSHFIALGKIPYLREITEKSFSKKISITFIARP